jgi:hypothetical protein
MHTKLSAVWCRAKSDAVNAQPTRGARHAEAPDLAGHRARLDGALFSAVALAFIALPRRLRALHRGPAGLCIARRLPAGARPRDQAQALSRSAVPNAGAPAAAPRVRSLKKQDSCRAGLRIRKCCSLAARGEGGARRRRTRDFSGKPRIFPPPVHRKNLFSCRLLTGVRSMA